MRRAARPSLAASLRLPLGLIAVLAGCGGSGGSPLGVGGGIEPSSLADGLRIERSTAPITPPMPEIRSVLPAASEVRGIAVSPDGRLLAAVDDQGGVLWDLDRQAALATLDDQPTPASAVAFDPAGTTLATAGYHFDPVAGVVTLWEPNSGSKRAELLEYPTPPLVMVFTPDGKSLVFGTHDEENAGMVAFVDLDSGDIRTTEARLLASVQRLAISPGGEVVACGASATINYQGVGEVVLFDAKDRSEISRPELPIAQFFSLAFTPGGESLAVSYKDRDGDSVVRLLDPETGDPGEAIEGVSGDVISLAFSGDGALLALGRRDGRVELLDRASRALRRPPAFHRGLVQHLVFSPDGRILASAGQDRRLALWDVSALMAITPESEPTASE